MSAHGGLDTAAYTRAHVFLPVFSKISSAGTHKPIILPAAAAHQLGGSSIPPAAHLPGDLLRW